MTSRSSSSDVLLPSWAMLLEEIATLEDGGAAASAAPLDKDLLATYAYKPSNSDYCRLLYEAARPDPYAVPCEELEHSAGWLVDQEARCSPVIVGHSLLSIIWLLRKMLPESTLGDAGWRRLTLAASSCTDHDDEEIAGASSSSRDSVRSHSSPPLLPFLEKGKAKRARGPTGGSIRVQNSGSGPIDEESETLVHKISNNNRQAERKRKERQKVALEKRRLASGLIPPNAKAHQAEARAYASITCDDEPIVAWIFKQPIGETDFYSFARSPYTTATSMVIKARALGNSISLAHARSFLQAWRVHGSPFLDAGAVGSILQVSGVFSSLRSQDVQSNRVSFPRVWDVVSRCEDQLAGVHIQYRWGMAFIYRSYMTKIEDLQSIDKANPQRRGRGGKGKVRSEAKSALFKSLAATSWSKFNQRLKRAERWYQVIERLGWGVLCLMPYDVITINWVEQTLRVDEWRIWLEGVVERANPDALSAAQNLDAWLGAECIEGASIAGRDILRIEAETSNVSTVEEVQDSEADETLTSTQLSQSSSGTLASSSLVQLPIHELFRPQ